MADLAETKYLTFPLTVDVNGPRTSTRTQHVREQIEQVLFTDVRERVFRPEFGVGVRRLVFEKNNLALRNTTIKRLDASLTEALHGEVDPRTLQVDVSNDQDALIIHISYVLAAMNKQESHQFVLNAEEGS